MQAQASRSVLDLSQSATFDISPISSVDNTSSDAPIESASWPVLLAPMIGAVTNGCANSQALIETWYPDPRYFEHGGAEDWALDPTLRWLKAQTTP